jgi:hypothetical protein
MDRDEACRILISAETARQQAELDYSHARAREDGMRTVIAGILKIYPDLATEIEVPMASSNGTAGRPRGAEAAQQILMSTPNKWFSVDMVVSDLGYRGWLPDSPQPANAVRTALERLITTDPEHFFKDKGEKTGKVVYAFKPSGRRAGREGAA